MTRASKTSVAALWLCLGALCGGPVAAQTTAEAPKAAPQTLRPHRPPHAAPVSLLPEAKRLSGVGKPYGGTPIDVTTYHYDAGRTGWNPTETDLTPATVASSKFGVLATLTVDGNVFAQPLLVSNFTLPDKSVHDLLVVVTGHDSVYAFDAQTYALVWQVSLGKSQSTNDVGCGDVQPEYGISSTPVIVRGGAAAATLYLVAATEPSPYQFHTQLHALDLGTGKDLQPPVEIAPTATLRNGSTLSFDPQNQWSRTGLAYANGSVYVGIGSHCDYNADNISGWMLRYSPALSLVDSFHTIVTPHGYELASIWMTGFAPAIDPQGNLFVVTGNGDYHGAQEDYGESVLKLGPDLAEPPLGRYVAPNYNALNASDTDFGSGGVMLLPALPGQTPLAVAMGKDPVIHLLNQSLSTTALAASRRVSYGAGVWGGPAYYAGPSGPTVFYQVDSDVLRAFKVSATSPRLKPAVQGTSNGGYGGALPVVSSNGAGAATGVVWMIRRSNPISLEAYDATTLGAPIYAANIGSWSNPGQQNPFLTPIEANGRVYAPAYKKVTVFGLVP